MAEEDDFLFLSYPKMIKNITVKKNLGNILAWISQQKHYVKITKNFVNVFKPKKAKIYHNSNEHWFLIAEKDGLEIILMSGFIEAMFSRFSIMIRRKQQRFCVSLGKGVLGCKISYDCLVSFDSKTNQMSYNFNSDLDEDVKSQINNLLPDIKKLSL